MLAHARFAMVTSSTAAMVKAAGQVDCMNRIVMYYMQYNSNYGTHRNASG